MNRRDSLKAIGLGTLTTGLLIGVGCKPSDKAATEATPEKQQPYPAACPKK
jgi:gluconate 2-dehydrogenase gamma chain